MQLRLDGIQSVRRDCQALGRLQDLPHDTRTLDLGHEVRWVTCPRMRMNVRCHGQALGVIKDMLTAYDGHTRTLHGHESEILVSDSTGADGLDAQICHVIVAGCVHKEPVAFAD